MQPTLGFAKSASYEQENIIPITKSYGFKMWSRIGLENAIQKCILITEENYDELMSVQTWPKTSGYLIGG